MNVQPIPMAIILGLLAVMLNAAPLALGVLGLMLSPLTILPVYVSVLGFGTIAGLVSGLIAAAATAYFFGFAAAASFFGFLLAPALWSGYMAGLADTDETGKQKWFPLWQIFFRLTLAVGVVALVFILLMKGETEKMEMMMRSMLETFAAQSQQPLPFDAGALDATAKRLIAAIPFTLAASLLLLNVLNFHLGARIARGLGWMLRPQDDIPTAAQLPTYALAVFAAAVLAMFAGGDVGLVGKVFTGAFGAALMLVGLATLHALSRGWALRGLTLAISYAALVVSFLPVFVFTVLGIAETLFRFRDRQAASPNQT